MNLHLDNLYDLPVPSFARGFFDPKKTSEWMHEDALSAFQEALNKIETPDHKLKVTDIHLVPGKAPTIKEQKQAILEKRDLVIPIKGKVQLIDKKTGQVVDEKTTTLASLPRITDRNTFVYNGSEYLVTGQQRLKSGIYTREKESGEVEAHVNVLPGSGVGGKIIFYPDKALFVYQVGTTQIKLYGLLKELGISDADMEKAWGKDIFLRNKAAFDGTELDKFYSKIFKYG